MRILHPVTCISLWNDLTKYRDHGSHNCAKLWWCRRQIWDFCARSSGACGPKVDNKRQYGKKMRILHPVTCISLWNDLTKYRDRGSHNCAKLWWFPVSNLKFSRTMERRFRPKGRQLPALCVKDAHTPPGDVHKFVERFDKVSRPW